MLTGDRADEGFEEVDRIPSTAPRVRTKRPLDPLLASSIIDHSQGMNKGVHVDVLPYEVRQLQKFPTAIHLEAVGTCCGPEW